MENIIKSILNTEEISVETETLVFEKIFKLFYEENENSIKEEMNDFKIGWLTKDEKTFYDTIIKKKMEKISISKDERKEFKRIEEKILLNKNDEEEIKNPKDNLKALIKLFGKKKFILEYRDREEKEIMDLIFDFFEKNEFVSLLNDLQKLNLISFDWDFYISNIAEFSQTKIEKIIFEFALPVLYWNKLEDFNISISLSDLDKLQYSFGKRNFETEEKNKQIIFDFFYLLEKKIREDDILKIKNLKDFSKNFNREVQMEDDLRKLNKNSVVSKVLNYRTINKVFLSETFKNKEYFKKWMRTCLNQTDYIPLLKLLANVWIIEVENYSFKFTKPQLKKSFIIRLCFYFSEVIYKKFEEMLPWPLLTNWIGLVGKYRDWKKKNFKLINSFWIDFTNIDEFKENLEDRGLIFFEKQSLWNSRDIYVLIKEGKITSEAVISNNIIVEYENKLLKNSELKVKWEKQDKQQEELKKMIEEFKQKRQATSVSSEQQNKNIVVEEDFGNNDPITEEYEHKIFYWIFEEQEYFNIDPEELELVYKNKFFTYTFKKWEHKIPVIDGEFTVLIDKKIKKEQVLKDFTMYLSMNRKLLTEKSLFYYSRIIGVNNNEEYKKLRAFFKPFDNFMLLKEMRTFNSVWKMEVQYLWGQKVDELQRAFSDLSLQKFWDFMKTDEAQNIWRYNIYEKESGLNDGIVYTLFTRKLLSEEQFEWLFKALNQKFSLWVIFN